MNTWANPWGGTTMEANGRLATITRYINEVNVYEWGVVVYPCYTDYENGHGRIVYTNSKGHAELAAAAWVIYGTK